VRPVVSIDRLLLSNFTETGLKRPIAASRFVLNNYECVSTVWTWDQSVWLVRMFEHDITGGVVIQTPAWFTQNL
jgi:hypothetical protein